MIKPALLFALIAGSLSAETFPPAEVKIIGSIDYGQTSPAVAYSASPHYRAFEFNGRPGDNLDITVHAKRGQPKAFLTDRNFHSLAGGSAHFPAAIPTGSKPATYYIIFFESAFHPAELTVEIERPSTSGGHRP